MQFENLEEIAKQTRIEIIEMIKEAASGHPGGSLSCVEILVYLYSHKMKENDCFHLSKGHAAPTLYSMLARKGYFTKENLKYFRKLEVPEGFVKLEGHPSYEKTPGVIGSSGSLGQGLSYAVGLALANKLDDNDNKVFFLMGDGESQEGMVKEAMESAVHFYRQGRLRNLIGFIDCNKLQLDGSVKDIMGVAPLASKWREYGWHVQEIDGHMFEEIDCAVSNAEKQDAPAIIVANTVKGKGVPFMEKDYRFHGAATKEQCDLALLYFNDPTIQFIKLEMDGKKFCCKICDGGNILRRFEAAEDLEAMIANLKNKNFRLVNIDFKDDVYKKISENFKQ